MTRKRLLRVGLCMSLAALFTWLFIRQATLTEIADALNGINALWVIASLVALAVGYACRIERWRVMLLCANPRVTWRACAVPFLASFAANNVLPLRAGDVLRTIAFNSLLGTSSGVVIATVFVERLLDLLTVVAFLAATLSAFDLGASGVITGVSTTLIAGTVIILLVLVFPNLLALPALSVAKIALRLSPKFGGMILGEIKKSLATLNHITRGKNMIWLVGWSLLAWLAEGCVFWFSALALPSVAAPSAGWLAFPVSSLATLMPGSPGEIGTFHYLAARAMMAPGNTAAAAAAYALLVHAVLWLPTTLAGGICMLLRPVKQQAAFPDSQS
jgi:glycosyltransferase 2 family protein